jgi:hypothetical protein
MAEHELWSFSNALFLIVALIIITLIMTFGISKLFDLKKIKANWAEYRCNPTIMPFASIFGHNTNENFEFCLGKIFNTHAQPYMGSMSTIFGGFTGLLTGIFDSISSLRNTIASIGGGINVIFQEFTERISNFFFKLRMSAIRVKMLMSRMYAIMFSVMYMGLSGITGLTSFTNTFLFSFLNTFCFPPDTLLEVQASPDSNEPMLKAIKDIKIGDVLLPTKNRVTATFRFYSKGQPMVKLGDVIVSTNHYVTYKGAQIKADKHPDAVPWGDWESDEPLYCLNTHNNIIPVGGYDFLDYDETPEADTETMEYIQNRINSTKNIVHKYKFKEYSPGVAEETPIRTKDGTKLAKDIKIGDKLPTGSEVIGLIRREVTEISKTRDGIKITPSTLFWDTNQWKRVGEMTKFTYEPTQIISFITIPNSQIELENGLVIRDYMELCSPDSEMYYSAKLEAEGV